VLIVINTMEGAFRKIDIDQYDEDVLLDEELYEADPRDPQTVLADARDKQGAVRTALSKCVQPCYVLHYCAIS
jgi:actin related protein 2/3 complex subunit 5